MKAGAVGLVLGAAAGFVLLMLAARWLWARDVAEDRDTETVAEYERFSRAIMGEARR